MKAIVYDRYGPPDVLQLKDVPQPSPSDHEVLVKVHAASVNGSDREGLSGKPAYARLAGLRKPRHPILGTDIAGRVEAVGKNVALLKEGDEVFGEISHGGFAEYACAPADAMALKPAGITFEQAAAIPQGGVIALQAIRKGDVGPGKEVLINGAGGAAGMFAVQFASSMGAVVTAVDNGSKIDYLRSLGADHVIDYATEDFTRDRKRYDLILDLIAHRSISAYARALRPDGTYFFIGGSLAVLFKILLLGPVIKRARRKNLRIFVVRHDRDDLASIAESCESGQLTLHIDRRYPLSQTAEALRYVGEGKQKGKVVIVITPSP